MRDDYHVYAGYPEEYGSLLDMAFRDRVRMWMDLRKKLGCEIYCTYYDEESQSDSNNDEDEQSEDDGHSLPQVVRRYFVHNDVTFVQPGQRRHQPDPYQPTLLRHVLFKSKNPSLKKPSYCDSGPDCCGEDELIRSATQFRDCMTEIVEQLSALQTFRWHTPITSLPVGVFKALSQLSTLMHLHISFAECREEAQDCE